MSKICHISQSDIPHFFEKLNIRTRSQNVYIRKEILHKITDPSYNYLYTMYMWGSKNIHNILQWILPNQLNVRLVFFLSKFIFFHGRFINLNNIFNELICCYYHNIPFFSSCNIRFVKHSIESSTCISIYRRLGSNSIDHTPCESTFKDHLFLR